MWIQNTEPEKQPVKRLRNEYTLGELVTFNKNGSAQVREEVGESLTEHYDFLEVKDNASNSD